MKDDENEKLVEEFQSKYLKVLANNISEIRKAKKITLPMLSETTGISINYLSKISSNSTNPNTKKIPTISTLLKVAYGLGCPPSALLCTKDDLPNLESLISNQFKT